MLKNRSGTYSTRIWPIGFFLLSTALASCAAQGTSPILAGDTRLAGGSGGDGMATWDEDNNIDVDINVSLEGGTMISDRIELGVKAADMGLAINANDSSDDFFSVAIDPGVYGRLYASQLGTSLTPWVSAEIIARNAVRTGVFDDSFTDDTVITPLIHAGVTAFLAENLAIEFKLFLGGYTNGIDEKWVDLLDNESFELTVGLSFFY